MSNISILLLNLILVKALKQPGIKLTINNIDSFSLFPSQDGAIKGNLIVHERQHLHHVSIIFPLGKLPSVAVPFGVRYLYTHH